MMENWFGHNDPVYAALAIFVVLVCGSLIYKSLKNHDHDDY